LSKTPQSLGELKGIAKRIPNQAIQKNIKIIDTSKSMKEQTLELLTKNILYL